MMLGADDLLDMSHCPCPEVFAGCRYAWEALGRIEALLAGRTQWGNAASAGQASIDENVWIGPGTIIEHGAVVRGPTVIGRNCQVRAGAYIRGNVIAGDNCVLGHASEFKNCILFDEASAPHFAYVGDSILGWRAHLGAGAICSNYKSTEAKEVMVRLGQEVIATGLRKMGAIVGDDCEVGCNCVLHPGTVLGRGCIVYPGAAVRGVIAEQSIVKLRQEQVVVRRRC